MGFLQTVGEGYKVMGQEFKQKTIDNRANIWTGVGILGTIGGCIWSWIEGMKSAREIDAKKAEIGRDLTMKEKTQLCWKNAVGPVVTAGTSVAGGVVSNRIAAGDIARLTTDVAMITKAHNEFKKATQEVITEKQQEQMRENNANKEIEKIKEEELRKLPQPVMGEGAPRPQLFVESFTGIKFWSTVDKVKLAVLHARESMSKLKPRVRMGYSQAVIGVKLQDILIEMGAPVGGKLDRDITILKNYGFNKGFYEDQFEDDDTIEIYMTPGECEYEGELRSCYVIEWETEPSDMKLGDVLKQYDIG